MMKHKGSSYCCRWFTLFLLAMGIVLVSPDINTDFADNYKQTKTKGTTTITREATTTTTTMNTNAWRTIKLLEAMGFIDANRYNVSDKNNNNNNSNLSNYNSNMLIANSNKQHISSARSYQKKLWSQHWEPLAHVGATMAKEEQLEVKELALEREHMVSTPQSMTIMVEKPTMVKHTTTTTNNPVATTTIQPTIMIPATTTTKLSASSTSATLAAASKPTTTTITITTTTKATHSTIKLPPSPDNMANINVSGINAKSTMMYKQLRQRQHEQQQQQQQQHWQPEQHEQRQQQHPEAQVVVARIRGAQKPQKYIGNTSLGDSDGGIADDDGDSGSPQATALMVVAMPERRGDEPQTVTATTQTQIAINANNNSNNNKNNNNNNNKRNRIDGITMPITATIATTTIADAIIIKPTTPRTTKTETTTTTTTTSTQSNQFESVHISYDYKANDATDNWSQTKETDVQMVVPPNEEVQMEVDRQYQQKFSNSYAAVNSGNTHNYAAVAHLSPHQIHQQQHQQQHEQRQWQRSRWVREAEEEPIDKCRQFNEGDAAKNEFYSPDYPNYYPKNINCTRVITAPLGQIIRLDFRNSFHIEAKEDCKFDVLEIRDGQYGFSNLLGKFCGTDFPPEITSRERYLWLHFHSDESIEYSGFTAVYEFVDRRKEAPTSDLNCTIEKHGFEDFANSTDVPEDIRETAIKNRVPLDCLWRIQVQDDWKILIKFIDFRLAKPNDCEANFLDIFPEQTVMPQRLKNFCGSAGEGMSIDSNVIHIRFYAEPPAINSTFSIMYTAYRERGTGVCDPDEEFDCEDATCISKELKCNSRDNCKFRWDELNCKAEEKEGSEHIIIIMIVFGLILGGMITTFLVNCIRKIMHDQKIIREHIRQSKESKLNEMGRNSKARSRENLSSTMPRPKHSQTSLQILNDPTSNHYYREVVPMSRASSKSDLKEREHSILRHRNDIVVQTSFCVDDNSSEATVEAAMAANACDMGCQTRESLFATPLMHQSSMGSLKDKASLHSRSRFSTFGYDAAQPTPTSAQAASVGRGGQLTGLNIRDAQEYIEMRERHAAPKPKMPHMHRMDALPPTPPTPAVPPSELCHHHHQHAAAHTHVHTQQQQQQHHHQQQQQSRQQSAQQQQQLSMQPSKESAGGRSNAPATTITSTATSAQGKVKPKLSQSTAYIDIRNSAPDVIIMTSH